MLKPNFQVTWIITYDLKGKENKKNNNEGFNNLHIILLIHLYALIHWYALAKICQVK